MQQALDVFRELENHDQIAVALINLGGMVAVVTKERARTLREALGEGHEPAFEAGRAMPLDEAVQLAGASID